ncbi:uncharacterized protein BT62DRAFT_991108 [Guyanagaster necrorhizus]|uniref:Arrestin-like N-terminal domain-containing protein n=1 Tax=Guyanagaster necrorhizus TaxID=856835 RepID=A0A9P8AXB5_9AGAR|nr:uncharacterized protein BT62DRAFT_991108 [Guyanagaster necrorhizus MCA 3950]KAG7451594.1 hypothetical protein BT62DRAFT_991108 [Guyanagaster necrorhizus MCA 3950]
MSEAFDITGPSDPPPPHYSCFPSRGEAIIDHSPRLGSQIPTGTFLKHRGNITVVLTEQEDGTATPSYGRGGNIQGGILLERPEDVCQVKIKVEGKLDFMGSSSGARSFSTLSRSVTLWDCDQQEDVTCSTSLPFSLFLPLRFEDNGQSYPLPPSFQYYHSGIPGLLVTSVYTLVVSVACVRRPRLLLPDKTETLRILFTYFPRARPERPTLSIPLFSGIKSSPEEWTQTLVTMKTKVNTRICPVQCNLFVPSVQTFAISDIIPFHVQLTGPLASLQKLFSTHPSFSGVQDVLSLSICRQVSVEVRGIRSYQTMKTGEGKIRSVPPYPRGCRNPCSDGTSQDDHLDWEGEVKCKSNVTVGGFSAAGVSVKDYIVISLKPPSESPFLSAEGCIPILLVTDTWANVPNDN